MQRAAVVAARPLIVRQLGTAGHRLIRSAARARQLSSATAPHKIDSQHQPLPQPIAPVTPSSLPSLSASSPLFVPNIPSDVLSKVGRNLHLRPHHPLNLVKERIESYFVHQLPSASAAAHSAAARSAGAAPPAASPFRVFDNLPPRVSVRSNFDDLLVPAAHPSRRLTDTYYFTAGECLRTHTSAHQTSFLRRGVDSFLVVGDCYRRDEIDSSHYPVFHQVEGVRVWQTTAGRGQGQGQGQGEQRPSVDWIVSDLQRTLDGLVTHLFGADTPRRWLDDSFPFTSPSLQVEVQFQGRWLEVLGCGVIQPQICAGFGEEAGVGGGQVAGWAFGLGLERLAMVLFDIPDIRLFWSDDQRFLQQFVPPPSTSAAHSTNAPPTAVQPAAAQSSSAHFRPIRFQPFSKYPPCPKDVSFFAPAAFHENDLSSVIRSVAGDWVESVQRLETFVHPKTGRESRLYRIVYRAMSHSLTNDEVNKVHHEVRQQLLDQLHLELR